LAKSDIYDIVDLKMVAYGNTQPPVAEGDSYSCQHGPQECESDALELCTQYLLSGDLNSIESGDTTKAAYPFILCMEEAAGDPTKGQECFSSSMPSNSTLTWDAVQQCQQNDFDAVTSAAMKATPSDHQYVPWVLVDGVLLGSDKNALMKSICASYDGPTPQSCKRLGEEAEGRCYKNV